MTVRSSQSPEEWAKRDMRLAVMAGILFPLALMLLGLAATQLPVWLWILFQ